MVAKDPRNFHVFHSAFRTVDPRAVLQTACIMRSIASESSFLLANMTMQDGGVDCGLYGIAYAIDYCFGRDWYVLIYNITLDLTFLLQVFPEEHAATFLAVSAKRSSFPFPIRVHMSKEAIRGALHHLL